MKELQLYHTLSRAVDGKTIFPTEEEMNRFLFLLYVVNHGHTPANPGRRDIARAVHILLENQEFPENLLINPHSPLVHILSFVLVGNHYHLCLLSNAEYGIPAFMKNLNIAFVRYFNLKHTRRGTLFESRYRNVPIDSDRQLFALIRYINIKNVLDVYQPNWRERGLKNKKGAENFLNQYRFSSFPDLFGTRNSKILAPKEIRNKLFPFDLTYYRKEYLETVQESQPDLFLEK